MWSYVASARAIELERLEYRASCRETELFLKKNRALLEDFYELIGVCVGTEDERHEQPTATSFRH